MAEPNRIFWGTKEELGGTKVQVVGGIYQPIRYETLRSWACLVRCPWFLPFDEMIEGRSADDAWSNAVAYLRREFRDRGVIGWASEGLSSAEFDERGGELPWDPDEMDNDPTYYYFLPDGPSYFYSIPSVPPCRTLRGFAANEDGEARRVTASIYPPDIDDDLGDWGCVVSCRPVFPKNYKIFGIDPEQALQLAEEFLKTMLAHHGVQIETVETVLARP